MTDMRTILRSFASVHKDELTRRSRAIVKQELRQNAIAIRKIHQYDEMTKRGITIDSYERAKAKADNYDNMSCVVRFLVDTGLNLAEGIVENVAEVAATTASLFSVMLMPLLLSPNLAVAMNFLVGRIKKTTLPLPVVAIRQQRP